MDRRPIRAARPEEAARVRFVEDDAGLRYADVGLPGDLDGLASATVEHAISEGLLWVVPDAGDRVVAFALCQAYPGALHLRELDVLRAWQGRGLGRALLGHVGEEAARRGLARVTLTTFRDIPFNAPFYARHGFVALPDADLPAWLAAVRAAEGADGLDRWPRVAMACAVEAPAGVDHSLGTPS